MKIIRIFVEIYRYLEIISRYILANVAANVQQKITHGAEEKAC